MDPRRNLDLTKAGGKNNIFGVRVDDSSAQQMLRECRFNLPDDLESILQEMLETLERMAKNNAPVVTGEYQKQISAGIDMRGTKGARTVVRAFLKAAAEYSVYVEYQYHAQTGLWGCIIPTLEEYSRDAGRILEEKLFRKLEDYNGRMTR